MFDIELEAVVIYDSILFERGHMIRRWAEAVERNFTSNAKKAAPMRSGELIAGIYGSVSRTGVKHLETTIWSTAPHSLFVLKGTHGPITSTRATDARGRPPGKMRLAPGNGYGVLFRESVSGQDANNFFAVAAWRTASRHPSLRGFSPGFGYE